MSELPIIEYVKKRVPGLEKEWAKYKHMLREKSVPPKTVLIKKGQYTKDILIVRKGCLRLLFDDKGKDVTMAFFCENRAVTSIHSYRGTHVTSKLSIESIEPTDLYIIKEEDAIKIYRDFDGLKEYLLEYVMERFDNYLTLFLSRIKESPEERYLNLIREQPEVVKRIPQHYIASYLGITPVSLSRIRNRVWKEHKDK